MFFRAPKYNPRFPKRFERFVWIASGLLAVCSLLGFLGGVSWLCDLFAHFRVQYLQAALLLAGICLWVRRNQAALVLLVIAAFNYIFILPLYMNQPDVPPNAKPVRAMLMNLNAENGNTEQVIAAITNANPDFIVLEEVTPQWAFELAQLAELYPHHVVEPQNGCFGISLLSRHPITAHSIEKLGSAEVPTLVAELRLPPGKISVVGTHPLPPLGGRYSAHRNRQLAALPELVKAQVHPVLLIGDLNCTKWSTHFSTLLKNAGLQDSTSGFGFQPTWPDGKPFIRIPIDHVLHSPGITIHNRGIGRSVGSDHLPVIVDFSIEQ